MTTTRTIHNLTPKTIYFDLGGNLGSHESSTVKYIRARYKTISEENKVRETNTDAYVFPSTMSDEDIEAYMNNESLNSNSNNQSDTIEIVQLSREDLEQILQDNRDALEAIVKAITAPVDVDGIAEEVGYDTDNNNG